MISELPIIKEPAWLSNCSKDSIVNDPFPLKDILKNSLYYPSSGFDGDPIKYLGGNILSFIYVDYGNSQDEFQNALINSGFNGYEPVFSRTVTEHELVPKGWRPSMPSPSDSYMRNNPSSVEKPFFLWTVFQRNNSLSDEHGPNRFSLLYLYAEGAAAFQMLYVRNKVIPKGIAVIQPGHNFGGNWTNFTDPEEILAKLVMENTRGKPDWMLYGGTEPRNEYRNPCWPFYREHICFLEKAGGGCIGLWSHR
jgi:hypothetical protein